MRRTRPVRGHDNLAGILNAGARNEGELDASGVCPSEFDAALIREVRASPPNLVTIRALLDQGASPNAVSNGVPLLVVAATLLRADVVGVLITAGADPMVKSRRRTL